MISNLDASEQCDLLFGIGDARIELFGEFILGLLVLGLTHHVAIEFEDFLGLELA